MSVKRKPGYNEILNTVEGAAQEITGAKIVLEKIMEHFDFKDREKYLSCYADEIRQLLFVVNHLLHDVINELNKTTRQVTESGVTAETLRSMYSADADCDYAE